MAIKDSKTKINLCGHFYDEMPIQLIRFFKHYVNDDMSYLYIQ